ncbi:helix-turn-helix domain-containing protein [Sporosarcina ureilytica]|uniref:HTH cro/C1-type domain-containing protein n=1 Tax=Sporosarcina ureilytica TaxID=298596 RepID=A0A1D8JGR2_9BACL|nr:helix-turn-helix transcriptional regulator [Sporosarcina ureilytica]AOV07900.1 hypothetical protein BI350_10370 [Sporosarcina ureilytica]
MFPKRLRILRRKKEMSQQEMADFLGITRQGYGKYENGGSEPSLGMLGVIADFFGVTIDYLIGHSNTQTMSEQEEFEAFAGNPELERWYKELPNLDEEDIEALKQMWEIIKKLR